MADFDIYTLAASQISISGGAQLSGITQGDGSHLVGTTITLNSNSFQVVTITDSDNYFADTDTSQTLTNAIVYDGTSHSSGLVVEAEYTLTVQDPSGNTYTLIGFNINEAGGSPAYGTVEGLAFLTDFPPTGVPLTVVSAAEGPGATTALFNDYFAPPCFVSGTLLQTPTGDIAVERLEPGDLVCTLDHGARPLTWVGSVRFSRAALAADAALCPIRVEVQGRVLIVSPQHRFLVSGWQAEVTCGEGDVLVAAKHLAEAGRAQVLPAEAFGPEGVTYWHVMFDRHELVVSNGIPTESFRPGPEAMKALPGAACELQRFFPDVDFEQGAFSPARLCARAYEGRLLARYL